MRVQIPRFTGMVAAFMLLLGPGTSQLAAAPYTGFYVFGDSLVDTGNARDAADFLDDLPWPFPSFADPAPPKRGYFPGRFTNGLNYADILSAELTGGALETVFPYGFPTPFGKFPFGKPAAGHLNFGYGGAQAIRGDEEMPDLSQQISAFADLTGPADPNALYLLTFGGNDLRQLVPGKGRVASQAKATAYLNQVSDEIVGQVRRLFGLGAQHIVLTGAPDIGLLPSYSGRSNEAFRRASASAFSSQLNALLLADIGALALAPQQRLSFFDFQPLTSAIAADPGRFGFADIKTPCLAVMRPAPGVDCTGFLFFDDLHPTAAAHRLVANYIMADLNAANYIAASLTSTAVPEPETWAMLLTGFISMAVQLRRTARRRRMAKERVLFTAG